MNELNIISNAILKMTSLALVDFINTERKEQAHAAGADFPSKGHAQLEHADFLKKVPDVLGEGHGNFSDTYVHPQNGQTYPCYAFPKREACLMAMSYSYELQAKVFDKMTALEAQQAAPAIVLPKTFAAALRLAAEQQEQIEAQQAQLALAAPKVAFVERYVESTGLKGFREVCKLLGANEARFREFLIDNRIMYRLGSSLTAYAPHLDAGRFEVRAGTSDSNGHAYNACKFTPKGIEWVAGEWAKHNVRQEVAA